MYKWNFPLFMLTAKTEEYCVNSNDERITNSWAFLLVCWTSLPSLLIPSS